MVSPLLNELPAQSDAHIITLGIRGGPLHHSLGTDGAHADISSSPSHLVLVVVHVSETGNSRTDHLST